MDPTINSFPSFHYNYRTYSRAGFRIAQNLLSASAFFSASSQNVLVLVPLFSAFSALPIFCWQ